MIRDIDHPVLSAPRYPREAGILLPVTSLPSRYGIGDLGPEAYRFIDQLCGAGQKLWQFLPVNPTAFGNSPYQSPSAFAGNPYMISPEKLLERGLLTGEELAHFDFGSDPADIDYGKMYRERMRMLKLVYSRWAARGGQEALNRFESENEYWLEDYALFMAVKDHFGGISWTRWEEAIRDRCPGAIESCRRLLNDSVQFWKFCQYLFFQQWRELRAYASEKHVRLIGDIPFYIAFDSADVWGRRELFLLAENGLDIDVSAGVPADGVFGGVRNWGNPLYDWSRMEQDGFRWWEERIRGCGRLYDVLRIDHVIALVRFYGINRKRGADGSAASGIWYQGPDAQETKAARVIGRAAAESGMEIVAEDLGSVNDRVRELLDEMDWSGMRVLQFAFTGKYKSKNHHLPIYHIPRMVVYTETHDNETFEGFLKSRTDEELQYMMRYLKVTDRREILWAAIEEAYRSPASKAIIPMQDILGLDNRAQLCRRENYDCSWRWRMRSGQFTEELQTRLLRLAELFGR